MKRGDFPSGDHWISLLGGVPASATLRATPAFSQQDVNMDLGLFAQEQWTIRRLTLNLGVRLDYLNGSLPERRNGERRFATSSVFPEVRNVPNWRDLSPRVGASYDLFGNARTAIKWNVGRYVESQATGIANAVDSVLAAASAFDTRAWTDSNGDFVLECDGRNPAANGECGPTGNANFGKDAAGIRYAPGTVEGWGTRGVNWETMAGIQHQMRPGVAVEASYHRRWNSNFRLTDNILVTPTDYDHYCVTVPTDARLPGSGSQACGLYDITPLKFGLNDNVISRAEGFGEQRQVFDAIDLIGNVRMPGGVAVQGGTSSGRQRTARCFVVDSPQELRFCDVRPPFQTQAKLMVVYPLPWFGIQTSATYQSLPGTEILAVWAAPAAAISPSLGRTLAGGTRTASIPLVSPGTMYNERLNQVDLRVAKGLKVKASNLRVMIDFYNLLNANTVISQVNTYGPAWQAPLGILAGRIIKFGLQATF
jgi:hypothetical protein